MATILEKSSQISIIFIGLVLFFMILKEFSNFLRPFVISIIISFLIIPITRMTREKKILTILNTMSIIIILTISFSLFGIIFSEETNNINLNENQTIKKNNTFFSTLNTKNIKIGNNTYNLKNLLEIEELSNFINNFMKILISSLSSFLSEFFLVLLFLGFILPSHDKIFEKTKEYIKSKKNLLMVENIINEIEKSIRTYLGIKTIISLGTGIVSGIVLYIFDVPNFIFFSMLIFLLNFIPNIGSIIAVLIVLVVFLIYVGFGLKLLFLGILLTLIQIIFGNILEPKIAGNKLELSPVILILSLFFWGYIWGIAGMFFAVPLTVIIKIIITNITKNKELISN
jgi:predicted PurR-regulated permease PerM